MAKEVKDETVKRIFIAGAGAAIKYKERHPNASESEVMSSVTHQMKDLIKEIEQDK